MADKKSFTKPRQNRRDWLMIGLVFAISAIFLSITLVLHIGFETPISKLTRDPCAIAEVPLYFGFLSQIGILLWSATAAICIFSAKILSENLLNIKVKRFLFISGLFTIVLCIDDTFQIHENLKQKVVFICYAGFILYYLVKFHSIIVSTNFSLLGISFSFFGASLFFDVFKPSISYFHFFEDGAKFIGIVSWLVYFFHVGSEVIKPVSRDL